MVKSCIHIMLASATLALLLPKAAAYEPATPVEQLPMPTQSGPSGPEYGPASPSDGIGESTPAGEVYTDSASAGEGDWGGVSISDSECSGCCDDCSSCCSECSHGCCCTCRKDAKRAKITADVELMALRTHFGEESLGKLGERYNLSERFVLGIENANGIGGRVRYWTYDWTTPNLQGGSNLRTDFDVVDFEGTTHFGTKCFDLLLAGGVRWADIKIDIDQGRSRNDMPGATFALDLRGLICRDCDRGLVWRSVSGARWSIFGGDWELENGLIEDERDDNITVTEIYGGVECSRCCHGREMYARLVFEAQNWRSDALGDSTGVDSIGFIGPGLNLGMNF